MKELKITEKQWNVMRAFLLSSGNVDLSTVIAWACRYKFYGELPDNCHEDEPEYALFYGLFFE